MQTASLALGLLLFVSSAVSDKSFAGGGRCLSGGCDVTWALNRSIDNGIRSKSEQLVGPAKQAFLDAMRQVEGQMRSVVDDVDNRAKARLSQIDDIVRGAQARLDETIEKAAQRATTLVEFTAATIRNTVIEPTIADVKSIVADIDQRISNKIREIDCAVRKHEERVAQFFTFLPEFNRCYREHWRSGDVRTEFQSAYRVNKCKISQRLVASASVDALIENYELLRGLANDYACLTELSSIAADAKIYGNAAAIWNLAKCGGSQC